MNQVLALILSFKVTIAHVVLYQPQNTVSGNVGATAVILCESSESLEAGTGITWHLRRMNNQVPLRVKSCLSDNDKHKYVCKSEEYQARLYIYNLRLEDAGVYYCMFSYTSVLRALGNGTALIVEDNSNILSSIHLLAPVQDSDLKTHTQLVCIVSAANRIAHVTWKISGRQFKGRLTSLKEPDGTWTVQNFLSLPQDTWSDSDHATCEVWFYSSPFQVHWRKLKKGYVCITEYHSYVRYALILNVLLMLVIILHLSSTSK